MSQATPILVTVILECSILQPSGITVINSAIRLPSVPSRITRSTFIGAPTIETHAFLSDYLNSLPAQSYTYVAIIPGEYAPSPRDPQLPVLLQVVHYIDSAPHVLDPRTPPIDPRMPTTAPPLTPSPQMSEQFITQSNANRAQHRPASHFRLNAFDLYSNHYTAVEHHHVPRLDAANALDLILCKCDPCKKSAARQ